MASNIDDTGIDETYPVAGVDNDTQGFRDNFNIIKNNFVTAKDEITNLQDNTVKLTENNNMQGSYIIDATLKAVNEVVVNKGLAEQDDSQPAPAIDDLNISYSDGHYHIWNLAPVDRDITFTLTNFPPGRLTGEGGEDRYARMRVELTPLDAVENGEISVTFEVEAAGQLIYSSNITEIPFRLQTDEPHVYEFWSTDGGQTVFCDFVGRFRTPS
jgi:hypothetical protein